jgi:hypothetical protein
MREAIHPQSASKHEKFREEKNGGGVYILDKMNSKKPL